MAGSGAERPSRLCGPQPDRLSALLAGAAAGVTAQGDALMVTGRAADGTYRHRCACCSSTSSERVSHSQTIHFRQAEGARFNGVRTELDCALFCDVP